MRALVFNPAHEAVPRLLLYGSPSAPGGLLGLQRPFPLVDQLVAVAHSVSRHHVHLRRVPLHALGAQGHPAQHGAQSRPISVATTPVQALGEIVVFLGRKISRNNLGDFQGLRSDIMGL